MMTVDLQKYYEDFLGGVTFPREPEYTSNLDIDTIAAIDTVNLLNFVCVRFHRPRTMIKYQHFEEMYDNFRKLSIVILDEAGKPTPDMAS